jgi:hypothetical protein
MDPPPPGAKFGVARRVGRTGQGLDQCHRGGDVGFGDSREEGLAPLVEWQLLAADRQPDDVPEPQGRRVEVAQGPQARLAMGSVGFADNVGHQGLEQFHRVVESGSLEGAEQRCDGGGSARLWKRQDRRRAGHAGEPCQTLNRRGRDGARRLGDQAERPNGVDPFQMPNELGGHAPGRCPPQVVQGGQGLAVLIKQTLDPGALPVVQAAGQNPPEAPLGTVADASDEAFERRGAGQQDLVGRQPRRRPVEEEAWAVVPGPGERVEPARQPEPRRPVLGEVPKAVALAYHGHVTPSLASITIGREIRASLLAELMSDVGDHPVRHLPEVVEEHPQEPNGAELRREAEAVVGAAQQGNDLAVGGIEMEMAGQLLLTWLSRIAAVAPALLVAEEAGRHGSHISGYLRGPGGVRKTNGLALAKHMRESASFCDMFCKTRGAAA